jgi:ABC-type glycerol-3-phosphate transport system substrate-binding protein
MYAQGYDQAATKDMPHPPNYLRDVLVPAWEKLHPGIKIDIVNAAVVGNGDYTTWVRTKATGGDLLDITWNLAYPYVNTELPFGTYTDLRSYLQKPDPYVAGNARWMDLFPGYVLNAMTAPNNGIYLVAADGVATGLFYNKTIYAKAGIAAPPKTYAEMLTDFAKIQKAGYIPFMWPLGTGDWYYVEWWGREFGTQLYSSMMSSLNVSHQRLAGLSPLDEVVAIKTGKFSTKDARFQLPWQLLKDLVKYMGPANPASVTDASAYRLFLNQKLATMFDGSWAVQSLITDPLRKFTWGAYPFPTLTKDTSPLATNYQAPQLGGPWAAFQYGIATPRSDSSMTPQKLEAAVDWLMFITAPQNSGPMVNSGGSFVPLVKGTQPAKQQRQYVVPLMAPESDTNDMGTLLTNEESQQLYALTQSYLLGKVADAQYFPQFQQIMNKAADGLIQSNHWDISKYTKK